MYVAQVPPDSYQTRCCHDTLMLILLCPWTLHTDQSHTFIHLQCYWWSFPMKLVFRLKAPNTKSMQQNESLVCNVHQAPWWALRHTSWQCFIETGNLVGMESVLWIENIYNLNHNGRDLYGIYCLKTCRKPRAGWTCCFPRQRSKFETPAFWEEGDVDPRSWNVLSPSKLIVLSFTADIHLILPDL